MINLTEGQCGLCAHFGEAHPQEPQLVQIRTSRSAPEQYVDSCGHSDHKLDHLRVSAISGCDGFQPAT